MKEEPIVLEKTINVSAFKVWKAITDKDQMREWYFNIEEFDPEVGFEFKVIGGNDEKEYPTSCKITEVDPGRKLAHTWSFDDFPAYTLVTWELFEEDNKTRVRLTHEGLENIPPGHPEASRSNHYQGWNYIVGTSLKEFLEKTKVREEY